LPINPTEERGRTVIANEKPIVRLYVDRACSEHWIVRDQHGQYWMVPPGENSWERRRPYEPVDEAELETIPGHYKYMLGLPG
jgi:hypothetical protein